MTKTKHTPGPWIVDKFTRGRWIITDTQDCAGGSEDNALVAEVNGYPDFTEQEANARLIAAAPELLEASEVFLNFPHDANARVNLRNAIFKATGGKK